VHHVSLSILNVTASAYRIMIMLYCDISYLKTVKIYYPSWLYSHQKNIPSGQPHTIVIASIINYHEGSRYLVIFRLLDCTELPLYALKSTRYEFLTEYTYVAMRLMYKYKIVNFIRLVISSLVKTIAISYLSY